MQTMNKKETGLEFKVLDLAEALSIWDEWLETFEDAHIRQSYRWAEYKDGWEPKFCAIFNGSVPMAMALVLVRSFGIASVCWINGGPVYRRRETTGENKMFRLLLEHIETEVCGPRGVLRLNFSHAMDVRTQLVLRQAGYERPTTRLDTGLTYVVNLKHSLEGIRARFERNWRNQLSKAELLKPSIFFANDPEIRNEFLPIQRETCSRQGIKMVGLREVWRMGRELGDRVEFFIVELAGAKACGGAVWKFGKKAWMALSASTMWGNAGCLPNFMYWELIKDLKEQGIETLDLTGIDPAGNWGTFNFKRGLGLEPIEMLGEWEKGNRFLRCIFNFILRWKTI